MKTLEEHIQILKENWNDFVKQVHNYMVKTNWTWHDTNGVAPSEERIKKAILDLVFSIERGDSSCISSGGLKIKKNKDNSIDCYFGECSHDDRGIEFHTYDINMTELDDFFKYLCKTNDILTIDYLRKKYREFIR